MGNIYQTFINKFDLESLKIFETNYWIWSLRPHQTTLGSGILTLKRECESFKEITLEESEDLVRIVRVIENTLDHLFKYDKINYLMMMMIDKQLHYHVIPRYSKKINFIDVTWEDEGWPAIPKLQGDSLNSKALELIKQNIVKELQI